MTKDQKEIAVIVLAFILMFAGLTFIGGCSPNNNCPETDFWERYAETELKNYELCFQSKSYQYLKQHRQMIKNLIEQNKYDNKDSFWVDNSNGGYELFYYTIGGYEFQKDGTLFGRKVREE